MTANTINEFDTAIARLEKDISDLQFQQDTARIECKAQWNRNGENDCFVCKALRDQINFLAEKIVNQEQAISRLRRRQANSN